MTEVEVVRRHYQLGRRVQQVLGQDRAFLGKQNCKAET